MPRRKTDEDIFYTVKRKLGEHAKDTKDVEVLLKIANTLAKFKAVELKMRDGEFGADLDDDEEEEPGG